MTKNLGVNPMATSQQIKQLKKELLTQQEAMQQRIEHNEETVVKVSLKEAFDELSSYDNHPADMGTELFEKERNIALDKHTKSEVEKIETALQAIKDETYGICQECGKKIPIERLKAVPTALFCVDHTPEQTPSVDRPVEEDVLIPPTGNDFENRRRAGEINDKEDSFGEVASFGTSETPSDFTGDHESYNSLYQTEDELDGFTEEYEGYLGTDIDGKNTKAYPTNKEKEYVKTLDEENIESQIGNIPYKKTDSYLTDKVRKDQ
jgi:YteA family regulatory protein